MYMPTEYDSRIIEEVQEIVIKECSHKMEGNLSNDSRLFNCYHDDKIPNRYNINLLYCFVVMHLQGKAVIE